MTRRRRGQTATSIAPSSRRTCCSIALGRVEGFPTSGWLPGRISRASPSPVGYVAHLAPEVVTGVTGSALGAALTLGMGAAFWGPLEGVIPRGGRSGSPQPQRSIRRGAAFRRVLFLSPHVFEGSFACQTDGRYYSRPRLPFPLKCRTACSRPNRPPGGSARFERPTAVACPRVAAFLARYLFSHHVEDRLLPLKQTVRHPLDPPILLHVDTRSSWPQLRYQRHTGHVFPSRCLQPEPRPVEGPRG